MNVAYLIRHGETDDSQSNIVQGHRNIPLNMQGKKTIKRMGSYLNDNIKLTKIITSDLERCTETAKIIRDCLAYDTLFVETQSLREIKLGEFEGRNIKFLNEFREKASDYNSIVPPGGESINSMYFRVNSWLKMNITKIENSLIISHMGPISVFISAAENTLSCEEKNKAFQHGSLIALELLQNCKYQIIEIIRV